MSGYILCQTGRAEAPYFIENISMNIYSLEELCYYLDHNLYLIDQTILNEAASENGKICKCRGSCLSSI